MLKWFRRKPKPAPPAISFTIPLTDLPLETQAAIAGGAKLSLRQYPAEKTGKHKYRSRCLVLLDGEPVGETEVTWEDDGTTK